MTAAQAAQYLGCTKRNVRYLIHTGKLRATRVQLYQLPEQGFQYDIPEEEVYRFAAQERPKGGRPRIHS